MENTSEEAKQRAKNYMSLKGALEPKTMTKKELMDFINFLDNRGLLSIPIEKHDYEKAIWEYEKRGFKLSDKPVIEPTEQKPSNHIPMGGCI